MDHRRREEFPAIFLIWGEYMTELSVFIDESGTFASTNEKNDEYGAGWVWCSKCKSYVHVRYKIPSWWKNLESINEDLLEDSPEYLDGLSNKIDNLFEQSENE